MEYALSKSQSSNSVKHTTPTDAPTPTTPAPSAPPALVVYNTPRTNSTNITVISGNCNNTVINMTCPGEQLLGKDGSFSISGDNSSSGNSSSQTDGNVSTSSGKGAGSYSSYTVTSGSGTNVFQEKKNSSNALGLVGPAGYAISAFPYTVKSCDQVLLIDAKRIKNYKDYCHTKSAFFTLSTYMINVFKKVDSNALIESITLDTLTYDPSILSGASTCIDIQGQGSKRIGMCMKSAEEAQNILDAITAFRNCRRGLPAQIPLTMIQDCLESKFLGLNKTANATRNNTQVHCF